MAVCDSSRRLTEINSDCHCEEAMVETRSGETEATMQSRLNDTASLQPWPLFEIATSPQGCMAALLSSSQ